MARFYKNPHFYNFVLHFNFLLLKINLIIDILFFIVKT